MAGLKEIQRRLKSVRNTKKITYAMKLVSAAKLRKAQEAVTRSRAYSTALNQLLVELAKEQGGGSDTHPLMQAREEVKNVRLVVVGGSRGLCGGYNTNINKRIEAYFRETAGKNLEISSILVGRKPSEHYRRVKRSYVKSYETLSEDANSWPIDEIATGLEADFLSGKVDEVFILYTKFRSAISMSVMCEKLLPLSGETEPVPVASKAGTTDTGKLSGVTLFEPSVSEVFAAVMPRILRTKVRQACLDAKASEQGSRMTAMDSATKNAGELIHKLNLSYNKLRQSRITAELLDIIGGAEAQV